MKKKNGLLHSISFILAFALVIGFLPANAHASTSDNIDAYVAYYDFLRAEVKSVGATMRDSDYYKMYTSKTTNAKVDKILAAYLLDVTGDGVEELIIKEAVSHTSSAMIDGSSCEWIRVYSYVSGSLKRIGQTLKWIKKNDNGSYSYYEPSGYIGTVLSYYVKPSIADGCLYYCIGADGKPYLADNNPSLAFLESGNTAFYSYNGSLMEKRDYFNVNFIPNWIAGSLHSQYGKYNYQVNWTTVTKEEYTSKLNSYTSGGVTKLSNNDYKTVLNKLKSAQESYYTPSSWATDSVNAAIESGYVPQELQKNYTKAITRSEFCDLLVCFYEKVSGEEIQERKSFSDTDNVSVQKMAGLGVVSGVGDGKFAPNNNLTREQAAVILANLANVMGISLPEATSSFSDSESISSWAIEAVGKIQAAGIMNGTGDGNFSPKGSYTREQSIVTLLRMTEG